SRTGMSASYISQVERCLVTPSFSSLKKIAQALDLPAWRLMFQDGPAQTARSAVVWRGERKRLFFPNSEIEYELLTPDLRRRSSVLLLKAPPGSSSGEEPFRHEGEDCVFVLRGILDVIVYDVVHRLGPGDAITFDSQEPHRWMNSGDEE